MNLARLKAKSVSLDKKNNLIVGSDTIIDFNGKILNKAKNITEARKKITKISGKKHNIYSSVSVFYNLNEVWKTTQTTTVQIRVLKKKEIDQYCSTLTPKTLF